MYILYDIDQRESSIKTRS